jgi:competence protein ComEA
MTGTRRNHSLGLLTLLGMLALSPIASAGTHRGELTGVVNLNTATETELTMLPGVGPTKAARIVEARQKRKFESPEQIRRVKGFGLRTLRTLKPYLAVSGATTIASSDKPPEDKDPSETTAKPADGKKKSGKKPGADARKPDDLTAREPT